MRRPSVEHITRLVATSAGLGVEELLGRRASRAFAWPRQRLYWAVRRARPDMTLSAIGRRLDRDHSTIHFGIEEVERRRADSAEERALCDDLVARLDVVPALDIPPLDRLERDLVQAAMAGRSILECAAFADVDPAAAQRRLRAMVAQLGVVAGCTAIFPMVRLELVAPVGSRAS